MPNAGYPDDDGSRDPTGQHDLGRQRNSCYPANQMLQPPTVADMATNKDPMNTRSSSAGDETVPNFGWAVDGDSNAGGRYNPAAYPSYTSTK